MYWYILLYNNTYVTKEVYEKSSINTNSIQTLEEIFKFAVEAIPYDTSPTSITLGSFEADRNGFVEYSEEFTFPVGQLFDETLIAGGSVELRRDEGEVTILLFSALL
jgi:hypothetical protein